MHGLDLSLEIPGAPVVCRSRCAHSNAQHKPAITVFEDGIDVSLNSASWIKPPLMAPQDRLGVRPPMADEALVRQNVAEALRQATLGQTTVVPAAATMTGELACGAIQIQGELSGSVTASGLVYIERDAVLIGPVKGAEMVILAGTVLVPPHATAIRCTGLVVLAQSARVIGHIQCGSIAIYEGACLVGTVQAPS